MNLYSSLICDIPAFYSQWLCNRFDKGYFIKCQDGNKYIRYSLNNIEKDIIEKHMWPLTLRLPKYKESYVVLMVDKYCALFETWNLIKKY